MGRRAPPTRGGRVAAFASASGGETLRDELPIDEIVDEGLQVVRPTVLVVEIVGVLPHVDAEQGLLAMDQRVLAVRRLGDLELPAVLDEPGPARPELRGTGLGEGVLEGVDGAEII